MSTRDLIDYAQDGNAIEFRKALYNDIHDRVVAHIEDKKKEIANGLMGQHEEIEIEEEYSLEDFTQEEIEEFMQTEDYEQLDELSKKTLGNYVMKAKDNYSFSRFHLGMLHQKRDNLRTPTGRIKKDMEGELRQANADGNRHAKNAVKRSAGIKKAVDRLTK